MKVKYIYWFAPYNLNCPSTRYRGFLPLKLFKNMNVESSFIFPERSVTFIMKFLKVYLSTLLFRRKNSIIVIQKVCSNGIYANLLKLLVILRNKNTQYDIDDAEYLRNNPKTLHFFIRKCSVVSVGSDELKKYCMRLNKNVYVLTSPVSEHNIVKRSRNKVMNIGWVGDFGNSNEITKEFSHKTGMYKILFPALKTIRAPLKLTLIGVKNKSDIPEIENYFNNCRNITINILKNCNWQNDNWLYEEIEKFDIGVSPMTNHLFNRSKSAFKAKQYLSVGVPVIANDVGENNKFVLNNSNGVLCKNSKDFKSAIEKFLNMTDIEYFKMSKNAILTKNKFSMSKYCKTLVSKFEKSY